MLHQPLLDNLSRLRLSGFRSAFEQQLQHPHYADLSFEERLSLLVDVELTRRDNNRLLRRLATARFPLSATIQDLDLNALYLTTINSVSRSRKTASLGLKLSI